MVESSKARAVARVGLGDLLLCDVRVFFSCDPNMDTQRHSVSTQLSVISTLIKPREFLSD